MSVFAGVVAMRAHRPCVCHQRVVRQLVSHGADLADRILFGGHVYYPAVVGVGYAVFEVCERCSHPDVLLPQGSPFCPTCLAEVLASVAGLQRP